MRRILASLFVIASVVGLGVMATGAYFTDTVTHDNYTFQTGSADLKFGFCSGVGADCSGTAATEDNWFFVTAQDIGPGIQNDGCMVVENTGEYALSLSSQLFIISSSHPDMRQYFEVAADQANSSCQATEPTTWNSAAAEAAMGKVASGITLQPGDRTYVILRNRWNSGGVDQNYLQNGEIKIKTVVEGKTV